MEARVPMDALLSAFGVPATLTPVGGSPVSVTAIWAGSPSFDENPVGHEFNRRQPRKVISIAKSSTVLSIPRGSVIVTSEKEGGEPVTWQVDNTELEDADHFRLLVIRQTEVPFSPP